MVAVSVRDTRVLETGHPSGSPSTSAPRGLEAKAAPNVLARGTAGRQGNAGAGGLQPGYPATNSKAFQLCHSRGARSHDGGGAQHCVL